MQFYIISILTVVLAITGILVETRSKKGKIKWTAYPIIGLIIILTIFQSAKEFNDDKQSRNKELKEIKREQQKHSTLLTQLIKNSKPITTFRFYYEFEIDTSLLEIKNIIKNKRNELINSNNNLSSKFGFNVRLDNNIIPDSDILSKVGNSTFFFLKLISNDSLSMLFQSGYSNPQKWYNIELLVTDNDYATMRFSDLKPSIIHSDIGFNSLFQLKNSTFELTPDISKENKNLLKSLIYIELRNNEGNKISSISTKARSNNSGIISFSGTLN